MKKLLLITCLISLVCVGSLFAEEHMITDKAELQKVSFELKPVVKGSTENMVLFSVQLKNISGKPMMYKMTAILDEKYAGEGIVPVDEQRQQRVQPDEVVTGKIAVTYDKIPTNFILFIDEEN